MKSAHVPTIFRGIVAVVLAAIGCTRARPPLPPEATMHPTSIENTHLRMQAERIGHGAPIVLIGGGLTGSASWQPHAERLAGTRDVVRLQLIGVQYGLEDRPLPDDYSVRTESRALAAALDALDLTGPIDLVAWSYGAVVTLDFALDHPHRVRTLTLIEPPALWTLPDLGRSMPDAQALAALLPALDMPDVSVDALVAFLHGAALVPPGVEPQSLPQWDGWLKHRRSLRIGRAPFTHTDVPDRLRDFRPPVLLVTGHGTSAFLRAIHDTLAATLPNARTLELPGGHAPQLAAMDAFLERLATFHARKLTATSRDGTSIAYWQTGHGPPLLLVHGATADHTTTWRFVLADLERHFTVYAMDRRGRGGSGDADDYEQRREAEDVAAVVEAIGEPVSVLGHSYGALAALEAALLTPGIDRLILYEGVPLHGAENDTPDLQEELQSLLEAGDLEAVLTTMYRDIVGMPADEIELLRGQRDAWARRLANTPTLPRELAGERGYVFDPERFATLPVPTLLLVGEDSPPRELSNARGVAAALPDAQIVVMPGQQHAAMYTAPHTFVAEIVRFLGAGRD